MRAFPHTPLFASLIIPALAACVFSTASFAQDNRAANGGAPQWMPIPQLHDRLEAAGYGNVEEIERDHGRYEVKATDRNSQRVKLYVNPQSGEVIDQRLRGERRGGDGKAGRTGGWRKSGDCGGQPCRDNPPQSASTASPAAAPTAQ